MVGNLIPCHIRKRKKERKKRYEKIKRIAYYPSQNVQHNVIPKHCLNILACTVPKVALTAHNWQK